MNRYLILILCTALAVAGNFITNGDFEEPLGQGWQTSSGGVNISIDRSVTYDPDGDYEARAEKGVGSGYAKLSQIVDIPSLEIDFSVYAKMYAYDNNADTLCWAGAAVIISYLDASSSVLGQTKICRFTAPCPWSNSSTCHLITAPDSFWHNYTFALEDELTNLPGVNPANVAKIEVALYDTTDHTC